MRVLVWHVHGSWMTAFVQGSHDYLIPTLPDRGEDGLGRARTWDWPPSAQEISPDQARKADIDAVVMQRPSELEREVLAWTGRRPGVDIPAIYLEHNTPPCIEALHPVTSHTGVRLVHVTHFNAVMWDNGGAETVVIEHGVVDPGHRYTGAEERAVAVINSAPRRRRSTGTDIVRLLAETVPIDLYGMDSAAAGGCGELTQDALHDAMAQHRVYLHANRWTSLGLSLVEAMHLGMPVVALAATAAPEAVPPEAGVVSSDLRVLRDALCGFLYDNDAATTAGSAARAYALRRFGLGRFLADWDRVLDEVTT